MALKNTYSNTPAENSVRIVEKALVKAGAVGMQYQYDQGRISAVRFVLKMQDRKVGFALPVDWRSFQAVLQRENIGRWRDEDYCYRVAWCCIKDWVLAQLALLETQMVELPQIFLPFAVDKNDVTLYEQVKEGKFLLGPGN